MRISLKDWTPIEVPDRSFYTSFSSPFAEKFEVNSILRVTKALSGTGKSLFNSQQTGTGGTGLIRPINGSAISTGAFKEEAVIL